MSGAGWLEKGEVLLQRQMASSPPAAQVGPKFEAGLLLASQELAWEGVDGWVGGGMPQGWHMCGWDGDAPLTQTAPTHLPMKWSEVFTRKGEGRGVACCFWLFIPPLAFKQALALL